MHHLGRHRNFLSWVTVSWVIVSWVIVSWAIVSWAMIARKDQESTWLARSGGTVLSVSPSGWQNKTPQWTLQTWADLMTVSHYMHIIDMGSAYGELWRNTYGLIYLPIRSKNRMRYTHDFVSSFHDNGMAI